MKRISIACAAAVAAGLLTSAPIAVAEGVDRYVSIGDSYTSAPLAGVPVDSPVACSRTEASYPNVTAPALLPVEHVDVSCGSAETKHVFQAQPLPDGSANAPQIEGVTADTTVVTIGLGGNDMGFGEIAERCFGIDPNASPCRDAFAPEGGEDELVRRIDDTAPRIAAILDAVHGRAPQATVFLVGYPSVVPDSGTGCWPVVPLSDADTVYLRDTIKYLNGMIAEQAAAHGASYVDTYTPSVGHDFCQPIGVKWIEGIVPTEPASPLHPNARGTRGMADALIATMAGSDGVRYTSLGDSYVAGALTGEPTDAPFACFQTDGNYPHLAAPALRAELTDVSCSSAKTDDMFQPQQLDDGMNTAPPQLDAVTADTTLVTLGIGANDIELAQALQPCFSPLPWGSPCRTHFTSGGYDELAKRIDETGPKVADVLAEIGRRAPSAAVFVVGYPAVFDDSGTGCWPVVPITPADTAYLRDVMKALNAMLAEQAAAAGASYVDTYTPGIGRDMCQLPGVKWIEGLVPTEPSTPFHPNARGERGFADALLGTVIDTAESSNHHGPPAGKRPPGRR